MSTSAQEKRRGALRAQFQAVYDKKGMAGVIDFIIDHRIDDLPFQYCTGCEAITPMFYGLLNSGIDECCVCGQMNNEPVAVRKLRLKWNALGNIALKNRRLTEAYYIWEEGEPWKNIEYWFNETVPGGLKRFNVGV